MIKLQVPISFAQMSKGQLKFFVKLMLAGLPVEDIKVRCLLEFSGLHLMKRTPAEIDGQLCYRFLKKGHGRFWLDVERFSDLVSRMDFLAQDPDLFDPPAKLSRAGACNSRLYGIRLDQWLLADNHYLAYANSQKVIHLDTMLAALYNRGYELWYEGKHIEKWARRFRRVPMYQKYLVFLWYTAAKKWLMEKYPYVFPEGSNTTGTPADELVMGFIAALNEGRVADNSIIKATELHEALYELNRKIEFSLNLKMK